MKIWRAGEDEEADEDEVVSPILFTFLFIVSIPSFQYLLNPSTICFNLPVSICLATLSASGCLDAVAAWRSSLAWRASTCLTHAMSALNCSAPPRTRRRVRRAGETNTMPRRCRYWRTMRTVWMQPVTMKKKTQRKRKKTDLNCRHFQSALLPRLLQSMHPPLPLRIPFQIPPS